MKNILITVFLFTCIAQVKAQKGQALYAEIGGTGIIYSVNYDMRFAKGEDKLGMRAGVSILDGGVIFPLHLNYLFGKGNSKFEVGAGMTVLLGDLEGDKRIQVLASSALMYRFQKEDGRFLFRAGLSPIFLLSDFDDDLGDVQNILWFWPGISFGYKL